jgi:NTE family protein
LPVALAQRPTNEGQPKQLFDLGLQGGGPHRAYTWVVPNWPLEEPWLRIETVSGMSAGAMNAAVMAGGYARGGSPGSQAATGAFRRRASRAASFSFLQHRPTAMLQGRWTPGHTSAYVPLDLGGRIVSPCDLVLGMPTPLRETSSDTPDFTRVATTPIKLLITTTNGRTGRSGVPHNAELTSKAHSPRPL